MDSQYDRTEWSRGVNKYDCSKEDATAIHLVQGVTSYSKNEAIRGRRNSQWIGIGPSSAKKVSLRKRRAVSIFSLDNEVPLTQCKKSFIPPDPTDMERCLAQWGPKIGSRTSAIFLGLRRWPINDGLIFPITVKAALVMSAIELIS